MKKMFSNVASFGSNTASAYSRSARKPFFGAAFNNIIALINTAIAVLFFVAGIEISISLIIAVISIILISAIIITQKIEESSYYSRQR